MSGRKDSEPIMTIIFVVINVLVFVVLEIMGDTQNSEFMAEHGAVWPPYVSEGHEYWRLLTATFMHFGFEHIANNMLILVCAGMILEKALGHVKFTILYLIAGVGGNVLSCAQMLHTKDYAVAAGASGDIFGIVGALLWIVILHRGRYESLTENVRMKIVVYYGGRGLLDDPTLYVLKKMEDVLRELRVSIERYNIYEHKNEIATLPQTFKEADGIILATTIEWLGIGGYMQQFLDACWLYGDKEKISHTYMQPIVMSTTYGEREGEMTLSNAWEILGGLPCPGLCGYVEDLTTFQMNKDFGLIIEKKAENLYRTISQKIKSLPSSNQAIKQNVSRTQSMNLTPQESEQLSKYVSDDSYVKQQKEDIEELASMFKDMLGQTKSDEDMPYIKELESHFIPTEDFKARYTLIIEDIKKPLYIGVDGEELVLHYGQENEVDVVAKMSKNVLQSILDGRMTFQRAFMTGEMTARGNFKTLRMLDQIFVF